MRSLSTFSILFWIYSKRTKNNLAPLYVRITVNGNKLNISLKRKVQVSLWDLEAQRIKANTIEARQINEYIGQVYSELFQCYQELKYSGEMITAKKIKSKYLNEESEKKPTIRDIIKYHNETMFPKLHGNTSRLYITSQRYILEFIKAKYSVEDYLLDDLNHEFILNFESFLRMYNPKRHTGKMGNNAAMKHIQRLRRMVTIAYQLDWIYQDPFRKFKQKLEPTQRGYLNQQELTKLENLELQSNRLRTVRDIFVFSCFTGMPYVDVVLLKQENLIIGLDEQIWISTKRTKNKNAVKVPLLPPAENLINKYQKDIRALKNQTLFPLISNQKMNAYLKEIAEKAGIFKNVTFHMARHTFATTVTLNNGVPMETISKMLGHRKLSTTQIYAKVIEKKVGDDMQILKSKLYG